MNENLGYWGEWELIELIGEGSFGKVYKARKRMLDKYHYTAVKIVSIPQNDQQLRNERANGMTEESLYEYFHSIVQEWHSEIELLETLKGVTNIVSIEDYQIVQHQEEIRWDIFIRMELLTQFNEFAFTKKLFTKDILKLGIDICRALEYCHKIKVIHRDIKPENIFVSKFGDFKLGDFGIARQLERTTTTMSKKGTNMYMAPEVYRGDHYDFTVDIYSLGLVLYRLFNNNKMPFVPTDGTNLTFSDRENSIIRRMRGEVLPNPVFANESISNVVLKACAFNPKDRYQSVNDFLGDLIYLHSHELENSMVVDMSVFAQSSASKSIKSYIKEQSTQKAINDKSDESHAFTASDITEVSSEKTSGIFGSKNEKPMEHEFTRGIFQSSSRTKEEPTSKT
jgi:serine/threonine-protein kinase